MSFSPFKSNSPPDERSRASASEKELTGAEPVSSLELKDSTMAPRAEAAKDLSQVMKGAVGRGEKKNWPLSRSSTALSAV